MTNQVFLSEYREKLVYH